MESRDYKSAYCRKLVALAESPDITTEHLVERIKRLEKLAPELAVRIEDHKMGTRLVIGDQSFDIRRRVQGRTRCGVVRPLFGGETATRTSGRRIISPPRDQPLSEALHALRDYLVGTVSELGGDVNQRMAESLDSDPRRRDWTQAEWAKHLLCSIRQVGRTVMWKSLQETKELSKRSRKI